MRVVILGGGISGLLAAHVFREEGISHISDEIVQRDSARIVRFRNESLVPTVIERDEPGGQWLAGGLRTLRNTKAMRDLLDGLGLAYSKFMVASGILLRGTVRPYPAYFRQGLGLEEAEKTLSDLWAKCHTTQPSGRKRWHMPDAEKGWSRAALQSDWEEFVKLLAEPCDLVRGTFDHATQGEVHLDGGRIIPFDRLVVTLPLWEVAGRMWFDVPSGAAVRLTLGYVLPSKDEYLHWDSVYTPYTPGRCVQRLSTYQDGYVVEASGRPMRVALESDLQFLFPDGYELRWVKTGLHGYLLPLEQQVDWPFEVGPVGRFAQWLPDGRAHDAYEAARVLVERWSGTRKAKS